MAVAAAVYGGYLPSKFHSSFPSPPKIAAQMKPYPLPPPISISTSPSHLNPDHLRELYLTCNHSCHRFPTIDAASRVEPVDVLKLRTALSHSSVVVSAFTKPEFLTAQSSNSAELTSVIGIGGDWIRKVAPVTPENGTLIGFGRAVSDLGLTASIYDVMVHPALQRRGIGRMIVQRIIRMLTSRDIYDVAALCSADQRPFFRACGFGDDILGSTTMMYTRSPSGCSEDEQTISAGRQLLFLGMGKIWVEICLISARGLRRTSALWKLQWFAVGWIDPDNKYCTKIDASGDANPVWKTKFSTAVDPSEPKFQDLALHVEVYSREPIFLRESLLGSTTIVLKEFLDKFDSKSEFPKPIEEVGSFQLRKKNSNKPLGFVDVSIRISEEKEEPSSSSLGGINLSNGYGSLQSPGPHMPQPESTHHMQVAFPPNYSHHPLVGGGNYPAAGGPSYPPPRTPPPLPPPHAGYIPSFFPMPNNSVPSSYINMPASVAPPAGRGVGPGFAMGVGAGALAAGAVYFGDDYLSGFDVPGASRDATITISTYPPF